MTRVSTVVHLVGALVLSLALWSAPAAHARPASPVAAPAAGTDGRCTDGSGVTVVVDFQQLGGGIVIRCAGWPLPGDGTGLDALKAAGIPLDGVRRWGEGFICRLYGKPSATQQIPVTNHPGYTERCIDTPPASAYWSYWHASNSGSWTYSQFGVKNRKVPQGSYEGWAFSLNRTAQSNTAPRVAPRHRTSSGRSPTPTPMPTPAPSVPGADPLAPQPGSGLPGDKAPTSGSQPSPLQGAPAHGATPSGQATPGTVSTGGAAPSRSTSPRATSSTTAAGDREDLVVDSDEVATDPQASSEEVSLPMLLGMALVAALLVMAVGTALRRRSSAE